MSSTPAPTALPWLLRWLLVVGTLAGLGIWQGGHCAADMSGEAGAHVHAAAAEVLMPAAASRPSTPALQHDDGPADRADTGTDTCHDLTATVTSSTVVSARPPSDGVRVAVVASSVPPVAQPPRSGITLAHLGVSRT